MRPFVITLLCSLAAAPADAQELRDINPMMTHRGIIVATPSHDFFERLKGECNKQRNLTWRLDCLLLVQRVEVRALRMLEVPDTYPEFMAATKKLLARYPALRAAVTPTI